MSGDDSFPSAKAKRSPCRFGLRGPLRGEPVRQHVMDGRDHAAGAEREFDARLRLEFGSSTGKADGVPLTIRLRVVNTGASCAALAGYAVYLWHCDALGRYSMYTQAIAGENYLRGVQVTDSAGDVTFTSIFPGWYDGRWPHFEVFPSLAVATSGNWPPSPAATARVTWPPCRSASQADCPRPPRGAAAPRHGGSTGS